MRLPRQRFDDEGDTRDVASHRMKRAVRGAVSIAAVITVVSFSPTPALAQPTDPPPAPSNASEALKQFREISDQAEKAAEELKAAEDDLRTKQGDLDKAGADLIAAQDAEKAAMAQEEQFRGTVDRLANASFQGARFNNLSALLTGGSQQDFLDRASLVSVLAEDNREALQKYTDAVDAAAKARIDAADAQRRSQEAKDKAEALVTQINDSKVELDKRAADAKKAYDRLNGNDRKELEGPVDTGVYLAPPGVAGDAMRVALAQVGKMYQWAAEGPNVFDCSGLIYYSYRQAGFPMTQRSSAGMFTMGKSVARDQLAPGDLLFWGSPSVSHVAMYVGDGKVVHASTTGQPVKVVPIDNAGGSKPYRGAKRIAG
jgi:cell wall-associated NlpC family hydrolase